MVEKTKEKRKNLKTTIFKNFGKFMNTNKYRMGKVFILIMVLGFEVKIDVS